MMPAANSLASREVLRCMVLKQNNSKNSTFNREHITDSLTLWSHKWLMTFNPNKCEFLRITNKINIAPFTYHIDNTKIQEVTLGVIIDQHLNWNEHIKQVTSKATKVNYRNHCNIYKAMIHSIVEYSSTD